MTNIDIIYPDDWHCHLRDGIYLTHTVAAAAKQFKRIIVMPNLVPPITTVASAKAYRDRILAAMPANESFDPLMVLYLTDQMTAEEIRAAKASGFVHACKLYPQGVTTNSQAGVRTIESLYPVFAQMSESGLPLLVHGEVSDPSVDIFDREREFITQHLAPIIQTFPDLKVVFEHITTKDAVDFVLAAPNQVAATITPHHLMLNRNAIFVGGIQPHHYCLPILKRKQHQEALIQAAISGNPKFFIGSDSAPHSRQKKEAACGCAGIFHGNHILEMYAQVFAEHNALDKLEGFTSRFGAQFYGLPVNTQKVRVSTGNTTMPMSMDFGDEQVIPFLNGSQLGFQRTALVQEYQDVEPA